MADRRPPAPRPLGRAHPIPDSDYDTPADWATPNYLQQQMLGRLRAAEHQEREYYRLQREHVTAHPHLDRATAVNGWQNSLIARAIITDQQMEWRMACMYAQALTATNLNYPQRWVSGVTDDT